MGACGKVAAACILGVLGALAQGAARAAELTILTNQGATPGVRELAAAFERATGHKVTVIQEAGAALERRLASGGPADLIASNPGPFDDLVKRGKVVAGSATPFVLAKLGLTEQLKPKTKFTADGPVVEFLAKGDFDVGIQQTNIMVGAPGTEYVGPLPGFLNVPCPSSVALVASSKEPEAARAMIAFMASPEAAPLLRKTHVEPATP